MVLASTEEAKRVVTVGQRFEVCLDENRTAGYRWGLRLSPELGVRLVGDRYERGEDLPGAAGTRRWEFEAERPAEGAITFEYARSWESAPAREVRLPVRVIGGPSSARPRAED